MKVIWKLGHTLQEVGAVGLWIDERILSFRTTTENANGSDFAESGDVRWDNICN